MANAAAAANAFGNEDNIPATFLGPITQSVGHLHMSLYSGDTQ